MIVSLANKNIRTLGVALSPCILPEAGKPTFEINDDEIEIGMGIHGEPGIKREKLRNADPLIDDLCKRILDDFKLNDKDQVCIMINSLGATPLEELYIISKRVHENFSKLKIEITKTYVGRYATSMEMAGLSITIFKLNNELDKHLIGKGIACDDRMNLYHEVASATVLIKSVEAIGAGVFIGPKVIATAAHVVDGLSLKVYVSEIRDGALAQPGKPIAVKRVYRIRGLDLAYVTTQRAVPSWLQLEQHFAGDSNLMIVGHPKGKYYSLQKARIKKKELLVSSEFVLVKDNEVFFGNSGGAIVSCNGHLVGIVSMMSNYENSLLKQGVGINAHTVAAYAKQLNLL